MRNQYSMRKVHIARNVAAAHVMAGKLGLRPLLGPACPEPDFAYALIISRAVRPGSKLSAVRWWNAGDTTTLEPDLGPDDAATDDVYAAMDWLLIPASGWCAAATPPSPDPAGSSGKARWPPPRRTWRKSRHQRGRPG
jgi:hypothetical protein